MILVTDKEEAEICRARADHLRSVAARMAVSDAQEAMLQAADSWEFLAELAEARASKTQA